MGYYSQVGIAVIADDKKILRNVCQGFRSSAFYAENQTSCDDLLGLFHEKSWQSHALLLLFEARIKWHELEVAWQGFSDHCKTLKFPCYFIRIGEDDNDPLEWEGDFFEGNDCQFSFDIEELFEVEVIRKLECNV